MTTYTIPHIVETRDAYGDWTQYGPFDNEDTAKAWAVEEFGADAVDDEAVAVVPLWDPREEA